MDKEQLKDMLIDMFTDGTITFNTECTNMIIIEIDGECVQEIKL